MAIDHLFFPAYKLTSIDADELLFLETMQDGIAAIRLVKMHRPGQKRIKGPSKPARE